jgi:hypothetical protein
MPYSLVLAGKTFRAVTNSSTGIINTETTMTFVTENNSSVLGVYSGGTIKTGQVIAHRTGEITLELLYHCLTVSNELKAGQACGTFSYNASQQLYMQLDWQWLTGDRTTGHSEWVLEREDSWHQGRL